MLTIDSRIEQDAAEIMELVTDNLHKKYVEPFEKMIRNQYDVLSDNPPPEIGLLSALKPFVDSKCCAVIDKLVYSYGMATMAKVMAEDLIHSRGNMEASVLTAENPAPDAVSSKQFPTLNIILPLIILLIFIETH